MDEFRRYINVSRSKYDDIGTFLKCLDDTLGVTFDDSVVATRNEIVRKMNIIDELSELKNNHKNVDLFVNREFDSILVKFRETFKGKHYFKTEVKNDSFRIVEHTLPDTKLSTTTFQNVSSVVDAFYKCLIDLDEYLDVMNDLDESCWVIDPVNPTYKDNYRRIVIDSEITLLITVDIWCAKNLPHLRLLGPTKLTNVLLNNLHSRINLWNNEKSFIVNLQEVLGISEFPQKSEMHEGDSKKIIELECSICFLNRDENGSLPSVKCMKATCSQNYHAACLYQWLLAVSSNMQRFNTIHGECPSCSTAISCPIVDLKF